MTRSARCALGVGLILWLAGGGLAAQTPAPQTPDTGAPRTARDSALQRQLVDVASGLRCPVCQNLSILDSPSELAQDMKRVVREQLAAGRSKQEIQDYFVARYGEWVLLKPAAHGATLTVWVLPALMLIGGGVLLWVVVRRWIRQGGDVREGGATPAAAPIAPIGTPAELLARRDMLRRTLAELDEDFADGKVTQADYDALRHRDEAELAAVRAALKESKAERKASPKSAPAATSRRIPPALSWTAGVVVFGAVAVWSLRGSVKERGAGGSMTGIQFDDQNTGAPNAGGPMAGGEAVNATRLAELERRVAKDSNDYPALLELGHLYLKQQRLERAAAVSMKAVHLKPRAKETGEAFAHLGMILWGAQETDGGLQALDQALILSPDLPEALLFKGIILFAGKNDPRGAVAAWERYLQVAQPGAETERVRAMLQGARQAAQAR